MQRVLSSKENYKELENYLENVDSNNIMVVCGNSFYKSELFNRFKEITSKYGKKIVYFDEFEPNPKYESVCAGVEKFKKNCCNYIVAVGGGSAIDVAKCIKLFANMDNSINYLNQKIDNNNSIGFLAVPTTAGTGSESTHFAVIYYNGEKKSVADQSSLPNAILFEPNFLKTLPLNQKKATIFDALSHSLESMWSVNSTNESIEYSEDSMKLILENIDKYLNNDEATYENVLKAANIAGKAINITKTTAGHAMCYKLTSLYNIPHGHAAILINSELYPYMLDHIDNCSDMRGVNYLCSIFDRVSKIMSVDDSTNSKEFLRYILNKYEMYNVDVNYNDIDLLVDSVNTERLSNNPIKLDKNDIRKIYLNLFNKIMEAKNEDNRFRKTYKF